MEVDMMAFAKSLYRASPAERVGLIRNGVPVSRVEDLVEAMHVSREHLVSILKLPGFSARRNARKGAMLSTEQSERVIGLPGTCPHH